MNYAEIVQYSLTLVYIWGDNLEFGDRRCTLNLDDNLYPYQMIKSPVQNICGALAVLLAWFVLLLYMRQLPKLGVYVMMFQQVLLTFIEVFFMFMIMIVAFASMFSMLMGNKIPFHSLRNAVYSVLVMMIGQLEQRVKTGTKISV